MLTKSLKPTFAAALAAVFLTLAGSATAGPRIDRDAATSDRMATRALDDGREARSLDAQARLGGQEVSIKYRGELVYRGPIVEVPIVLPEIRHRIQNAERISARRGDTPVLEMCKTASVASRHDGNLDIGHVELDCNLIPLG